MTLPEREIIRPKFSWKILLVFILVILLVGGGAWYIFRDKEDSDQIIGDQKSTEQTQKEVTDLMKRLGKLIVLPEEEPLVATIQDAAALAAEQPFYKNTENGDKLIIFPKKAQAVIYRPSENMLINVGPIFVDNDEQPATEQPTPAPTE